MMPPLGASRFSGKGFPLPAILFITLFVLAGVFYVIFPSIFQGKQSLEGTLIIYTPEPWTSPHGEYVSGLVDYDLSSGTAVELYPADAPFARFMLPETLAPDGDKILAVAASSLEEGAGPVLGSLSISLQGPFGTYIGYDQGVFTRALWSPQMTRIAYAITDSEEGEGAQLGIAPVFERQPDYGEGIPVVFSPDGESLLIQEPLNLSIVDVASGAHTPVIGAEDIGPTEHLTALPGASHVAAIQKDGSVSFYTIDWEEGSAVLSGTVASDGPAPSVVPGPQGAFLLIVNGEARVYALRGENHVLHGAHALILPEHASPVHWNQ